MAVMFIACAMAWDTRLTTNWPVTRILAPVSLASPGLRPPMPITITAGSCEKTLKKLNGAAFSTPCASWLTTQAIGRGTTVDTISL